jgi:hypothetical protein
MSFKDSRPFITFTFSSRFFSTPIELKSVKKATLPYPKSAAVTDQRLLTFYFYVTPTHEQ